MADPIDLAQDREQLDRDLALASVPSAKLDPGVPGDCDMCGEWSGRLIGDACAPCRDKYKLP